MNLSQDVEYDNKYLAEKAICATCTLLEIENKGNEEADAPTGFSMQFQGGFAIPNHIYSQTPLTTPDHLTDPIPLIPGSPFDAIEERMTDKEQIEKMICYIRDGSKIEFAHELSARLNFLHESVVEDPEEIPISVESLRNFISFLRNTTNLKFPSVVLTPSNEIRAQWKTALNRYFAVVFLPTGDARYVIFTPNPKNPDKIDRLSGITSIDSLLETAGPHGVLEWASQ